MLTKKQYLQSQIRSTGTAYLLYFLLFGSHYAYLGKWGFQLLYWFTLGGLGIWTLFDLFTIPSKVNNHNVLIFKQIEDIESKERDIQQEKQIAMITAIKNPK